MMQSSQPSSPTEKENVKPQMTQTLLNFGASSTMTKNEPNAASVVAVVKAAAAPASKSKSKSAHGADKPAKAPRAKKPTTTSTTVTTTAPKPASTSRSRSKPTAVTPVECSSSVPSHSHAAAASSSSASPVAVASLSSADDHGECCDAETPEDRGDTFHCGICEGRGELLLCDGPCGRGFHGTCMPERPDSGEGETWLCVECNNKEHECFVCKQVGKDDEEVFLCKAKKCGKFYHKDCIADHPTLGVMNASGFMCPRHKCASCNMSGTASRGKFIMCLRCTNSYHEFRCMPHSCVYKFREGEVMLCNTDAETLNATTDRADDDGSDEEEEIEMETAQHMPDPPVAKVDPFNPFAIPVSKFVPEPEPKATVADADKATASSLAVPEQPAFVLPSDPNALVSRYFPSCVFTPPTEISYFKLSKKMIKEGDEYVSKAPVIREKKAPKATPPYFKRVSANQYNPLFVSKPSYKLDYEPCMCSDSNDKCEENCMNRAMYVECTRKCENGDNCQNQRISRRQYASTAVVLTPNRGFGLIAKEDIKAGSLIIEYCGEIINDEECTRRLNETMVTGNKEYYFFKITDDLVIDAGPMGNNARFLNHACAPNCKTELWQIGCQQRVGIFTMVDVPKGEELTYDYNFEGFWQPGAELKCYCGSKNCAGTLGGKKKTKEEMAAMEAAENKANKKKSPSSSSSTAASTAPAKKKEGSSNNKKRKAEDVPTQTGTEEKDGGERKESEKPQPKAKKVKQEEAKPAEKAPKKRAAPKDRTTIATAAVSDAAIDIPVPTREETTFVSLPSASTAAMDIDMQDETKEGCE